MKLSKAKTLAIELMQEWDLTPRWSFEFDNAKRRFGCCKIGKKKITLSKHLTKRNKLEDVKDTILHEIAHALDYEDRGKSDHSEHWKRWARKVGADDSRCYDGDKINGVEYKYYDYCPNCGQKSGRHRARSHKKLLASCGQCSSGFDKNYMMIFNIPAAQMDLIEHGQLEWWETEAAGEVIKKMEWTYLEGDCKRSKFYSEFISNKFSSKKTKTAARTKKKKSTKKQSINTADYIATLIQKGEYTRQQIISKATEKLDVSKSTVSTYLTDGKNPKYNRFDSLVVENSDGTIAFKSN